MKKDVTKDNFFAGFRAGTLVSGIIAALMLFILRIFL